MRVKLCISPTERTQCGEGGGVWEHRPEDNIWT